MNIGFVTQALPYLPSRDGFRLYGANLIRCLSANHTIELVSLLEDGDEDHIDWPKQYCSSVTAIPTESSSWLTPINVLANILWAKPLRYRRALQDAVRARMDNWDIIHCEGSYVGSLIPDWPKPMVLSLHDSQTLRSAEMLKCSHSLKERLYYRFLSWIEPRIERNLYSRFDRCTVVADRDLAEVKRVVPACKVELVPSGTDTEYFHPLPVQRGAETVVFHGHLGYAPNIEAALEFANHILPLIRSVRPNAAFHLVGADPAPQVAALASAASIRLFANLPDLRATICSAAVYVCAIRSGTGIKNKLLEAMAMRMPIVCYPECTLGLAVIPGEHLLVAETPRDFAAHVLHLLDHPARAQQLAYAGRQLVEAEYSWQSRASVLEGLYEEVINAHETSVVRGA